MRGSICWTWDGAREIIDAGRQGEGALTGTAACAWKTDDVARADRAAAAAGGYANPPTLADAAVVTEQQGYRRRWGTG
jgi:hypothetical protein